MLDWRRYCQSLPRPEDFRTYSLSEIAQHNTEVRVSYIAIATMSYSSFFCEWRFPLCVYLTRPPFSSPTPRLALQCIVLQTDAWIVINQRVYNVTDYLPYHPGGVSEIMKGAGIDATVLFNEAHSFVNVEMMLEKHFIGVVSKTKT